MCYCILASGLSFLITPPYDIRVILALRLIIVLMTVLGLTCLLILVL